MKRKVIIFLCISFLLYGCSAQSVPMSQSTVAKAAYSNSSETETQVPKQDNYTFHENPLNTPKDINENTANQHLNIPLDPKFVHYKNKVIVLMYHHIDEKESAITISPNKFKQHIQALLDNHYQIIPMDRFIHFLQNKEDVPPNAVVITFDDGYESFYKYAYPELKTRGLTATNFVIVSYIDKPNPGLPFLTWSEMTEMKQSGFSFYSHTYNLHASVPNEKGINVAPLTNRIFLKSENRLETEGEYRKRVIDDLNLADKVLEEKLGNSTSLLCFPLGAYNSEVIKLAHEVGIQFLFTIQSGINSRSDKEIKRVHAGMPYITADILIRLLKKYSVDNK